jgi:hypothetical protein
MAFTSLGSRLKTLFSVQSASTSLHATSFSTHPPSIILPLYIYPNPNAWNSFFNSIAKYPNVQFTIIINPSSGPGTTAFPDEEYITGIAKLNTFLNVKLLGYVRLDYGKRDITEVKSDIDVYAGWESYRDKMGVEDVKIGVKGIFFDESPSIYEKESFTYLEAVTRYPRRALAFGSEFLLNPGTVTDERICKLVDGVVEFEDFHRNFKEQNILEMEKKQTAKGRRKRIVIVHHLQGGVEEMKKVVDCCVRGGVDELFVNDKEYDEVGELWMEFCEVVAAVGK